MKRLTTVTAGMLLAVAAFSGCGGDSETDAGDYCDRVENMKRVADSLGDPASLTLDDMRKASDAASSAADAAPDDVQDSWQKVADGLASYVSDLEDAGVGADTTLTEMMKNPDAKAAITDAATAAESIQDDQQAINDSASEECDVELENAGS